MSKMKKKKDWPYNQNGHKATKTYLVEKNEVIIVCYLVNWLVVSFICSIDFKLL